LGGGASSRSGSYTPKGGAVSTTGPSKLRTNLFNVVILLIGFLTIVALIWRAFQPVLGKADDRERQLSEWRAAKDARNNGGDIKVFVKDPGAAT
jgi:hypothetical protein